jgi:putative phosphoribosyl transferase
MLFQDRCEAGQILASRLLRYADRPGVLVLALPRGGVPVGFEVARALRVPLDVFLVRKLGVPGRRELAMGAIASGGAVVLNDIVDALGITVDELAETIARERAELERREHLYRGDRPPPAVHGRTVILVDDGAATGASMRVAAAALRRLEPGRLVVALPVGTADACASFASEVDEAVCAETPEPFYSVGLWYSDFSQVTDDEVRALLDRAAAASPLARASGDWFRSEQSARGLAGAQKTRG